jgi:hypothetical protein
MSTLNQILTIEELQDAIALKKEIYEVDSYRTDKGKIKFSKGFNIWNFEDNMMEQTWTNPRYRPNHDCCGRSKTLNEWIKSESLFWCDKIKLKLNKTKRIWI